MADRPPAGEQFRATERDRRRQAVDLLAYALAVLVVLLVVLGAVSAALGMGLVGVKYGLFVVGFLMFGLGAVKLRPVRPDKDPDETHFPADRGEETVFQARVQRLLPARYRLDHDDRLSDATKLFVASLFVLGVSYAMEAAFDVAV